MSLVELVPIIVVLVIIGTDLWVYTDARTRADRGDPVVYSLGSKRKGERSGTRLQYPHVSRRSISAMLRLAPGFGASLEGGAWTRPPSQFLGRT
jgi:hypothetical protein